MSEKPLGFAARHEQLELQLRRLRDPQQRLAWVVERARSRPPFPPIDRCEEWLVKGCAARLWIRFELEGGLCRFACDSDSAILKATAGLLCELYDGLGPIEVAEGEPAFIETTGLLGQLTENRRRTIQRAREVIRDFARACGSTTTPQTGFQDDAIVRRPQSSP